MPTAAVSPVVVAPKNWMVEVPALLLKDMRGELEATVLVAITHAVSFTVRVVVDLPM
jgi:hypothetical protein